MFACPYIQFIIPGPHLDPTKRKNISPHLSRSQRSNDTETGTGSSRTTQLTMTHRPLPLSLRLTFPFTLFPTCSFEIAALFFAGVFVLDYYCCCCSCC